MRDVWSQVSVIIAVLGVIAVNSLANIVRLGGVTTGEVSARYPTAFTPAGYVFLIWSGIYLGLIALALAQAFARPAAALMKTARAPFLVSCAANAGWILLWHTNHIALSVLVMIVLLVSLTIVYRRFQAQVTRHTGALVRWTMLTPISVYLGWICVATVANVTVWLVSLGVGGEPGSDSLWSAIMMIVALAIGAGLAARFRDPAPALVLAWAFAGIGVAHPELLVLRVVAFVLAAASIAVAALAARPHPATSLTDRRQ